LIGSYFFDGNVNKENFGISQGFLTIEDDDLYVRVYGYN